jgi:hypothetical protein
MLYLRQDWRQQDGGTVALDLLAQVPREMRQTQFTRTFILASLDLAIATTFANVRPRPTIDESRRGSWRLEGMTYLFFPILNDDAYFACREAFAECRFFTRVIVPANHGVLLRRALRGLPCVDYSSVRSFEDFVSGIASCSDTAANWSHEEAMQYLFRCYNARAETARLGRSMSIRLPRRLKLNSRPCVPPADVPANHGGGEVA